MTSMNQQVFQAILAMDAYNRGYNQGVFIDTANPLRGLGTATFVRQSNVGEASYEYTAGFYAVAYDWEGTTHISYRGTDGFLSDVLYGYATGGGFPSTQAGMAVSFYQDVANIIDEDDALPLNQQNIKLTGHSLGGGLAGLVAGLYGRDALLFANMPYEQAVSATYSDALYALYTPNMAQEVYGSATPWAPHTNGIEGYAVYGEFLGDLRGLTNQTMVPTVLAQDVLGASLLGPIQRHSQALATILLYAETQYISEGGGTTWKFAAPYFLPNLFDEEITERAGFVQGTEQAGGTGNADIASQMITAIAYSAINEGYMPFGNVGIRALLNDADDLGRFLPQLSSTVLSGMENELAKNLVLFSAQTAAWGETDTNYNSSSLFQGIYSVNDANSVLGIALVDGTYSLVRPVMEAVGFEAIEDDLGEVIGFDFLGFTAGYGSLNADSDLADEIDPWNIVKVNILSSSFTGYELTDTLIYPEEWMWTITIGNGPDEAVIGSKLNDIIALGEGNDTYIAGGGQTLFFGGGGIDTAYYSTQNNVGIIVTFEKFLPYAMAYYDDFESEDRLSGVEVIIGTMFGDKITLGNFETASLFSYIDLGTSTSVAGDTIDASGLDESVTINLANAESQVAYLTNNISEGMLNIRNATAVIGSQYGDLIYANQSGSFIQAGSGNDTIIGGDSVDIIYGGGGEEDAIFGYGGNDIIYTDPSTDFLLTTYGSRVVNGGSGHDYIAGSGHLSGGTGHDVYALTGLSTIYFGYGDGHDTIFDQHMATIDMSSVDRLDIEMIWDLESYSFIENSGIVDFYSGTGTIMIRIKSTGDTILFNGEYTDEFALHHQQSVVDGAELWSSIWMPGSVLTNDGWAYFGGEGGNVSVVLGDTSSAFNVGLINLDTSINLMI